MKAKLEIKGEIAEDYLYEFVNAHSGLSIYELSKRLGWSTGKVYNIIKVLEDDGLVKTIKIEERASIKEKHIISVHRDAKRHLWRILRNTLEKNSDAVMSTK